MGPTSSNDVDKSAKSKAKVPTPFVIASDEVLSDGSKVNSGSADKASKNVKFEPTDNSSKEAESEKKSPKELVPIPLVPADILVSAMMSKRAEFEKEAQKKIMIKELSWAGIHCDYYSSVPLSELIPCMSLKMS